MSQTDRQTDGRTDISISWAAFAAENLMCADGMTIIGALDDKSSLENDRLPRLLLNTHVILTTDHETLGVPCFSFTVVDLF